MRIKYRILLHSMTFKRDFGICYMLARILEQMGCECFIANDNNYIAPHVKYWNPHAIFYVTLNRTRSLRKAFPNAKLFLCAAEGAEEFKYCSESEILTNEFYYKNITKSYFWGEMTLDHIKKQAKISSLPDDYKDKFVQVGHPRMDIIKLCPADKMPKDKLRIGFIGCFSEINKCRPRFSIMKLLLDQFNEITDYVDKSIESIAFQMRIIIIFARLMNELDNNKYEISIRPYPQESVNIYKECQFICDKNVQLDESIDFNSWLARQDIVIGPISSTISQIYMGKIPYIMVDKLAARPNWNFENDFYTKIYNNLSRNIPDKQIEVLQMIENHREYVMQSEQYEKDLSYLFGFDRSRSSVMNIGKDMLSELSKTKPKNQILLPLNLVFCIDSLFCHLLEIKNPGLKDNSYSYFNYSKIKTQANEEFMPVVKRILEMRS